jgi:hypothetical protein
MTVSASIEIPLPQARVFRFFDGLETWFRLNPQWHVLSVEGAHHVKKGQRFRLRVRYDRNNEAVDYDGVVENFVDGDVLSVHLNAQKPKYVKVYCANKGSTSLLKQEEVIEDEPSDTDHQELVSWLKSVAWYLTLQNKNTSASKLWKFFMDKVWLKMSPAGRRIVFLVIIAEGAGFIFFLLFLVVHYAQR